MNLTDLSGTGLAPQGPFQPASAGELDVGPLAQAVLLQRLETRSQF
jgi:hypothetical protein